MTKIDKRDSCYFDNAKFILILLVVIGHLIEPMINKSEVIKSIYILIYLFHMPAFILICGYFENKDGHNNKIAKLVATYIIFQITYYIFNVCILKNNMNFSLTMPYWILWFLVSLILWKIITPYFIRFKCPIITAFILGILIGYEPTVGYYLSLSRTITFYPFFLIGYFASEKHFKELSSKKFKNISGIGIIMIFVFIYITRQSKVL